MIRKLLLSLFFALSFILLLAFYNVDVDGFIKFYSADIRASLFSGLLTVGGLLLSLKTFIVIKLKENVYDTSAYGDLYTKMLAISPDLKRYAPLERLSSFLFVGVGVTLAAAFTQFTVGLIPDYSAVLFSCFIACFSICLLLLILDLLNQCLKEMFSFLNKK